MNTESKENTTTVVIHLPPDVSEKVEKTKEVDLRTRKAQCEFYVRDGVEKHLKALKRQGAIT